jgi:hypothetical protein
MVSEGRPPASAARGRQLRPAGRHFLKLPVRTMNWIMLSIDVTEW